MKLHFWRDCSKPKVEPADNIEFVISVSGEGMSKLEAYCQWPVPGNEQEEQAVVQKLGTILSLLNGGELLPLIQQTVAEAGIRDEMEGTGQKILDFINIVREKGSKAAPDKLVVTPREVFNPRQERLNTND